jgi:hypothetical protein
MSRVCPHYDNRPDRGQTWTDGAGTKLFRFDVKLPGQPAMRVTIRGIDARQAKRFALARWGSDAQIKGLGEVR